MKDYDVLTTMGKTEFVYIHVHKHSDRQCYWLGQTDHSGVLQVFTDVRYASAFACDEVFDMCVLFSMQHPEVSLIKSWECDSRLHLTPAMRKVLRV